MRNIGIAIIDDESLVRLGIKSSVAAQDKNLALNLQLLQGFQNFDPVHHRHTDVEQDDIRVFFPDHLQAGLPVVRFSYNLIAILFPRHRRFLFCKRGNEERCVRLPEKK